MCVLLNRQSQSQVLAPLAPVVTRRLGIEEMRLCMVRAESVLCSLAVLLVDRAPHVCARCSDLAHPTFSLRGWFTSSDMKDHGNALVMLFAKDCLVASAVSLGDGHEQTIHCTYTIFFIFYLTMYVAPGYRETVHQILKKVHSVGPPPPHTHLLMCTHTHTHTHTHTRTHTHTQP